MSALSPLKIQPEKVSLEKYFVELEQVIVLLLVPLEMKVRFWKLIRFVFACADAGVNVCAPVSCTASALRGVVKPTSDTLPLSVSDSV